MTTTCETYRDRLLDHAYGLLDEADAWPMATHLRDCAACRAAQEKAVGLIASASKSAHPGVTFTPPAPKSAAASRVRAPRTVREACARWAVAASLLLTGAALGGPGLRDLAATAWYRVAVNDSFARHDAATREANRLAGAVVAARADLAAAAATARADHDRAAEEWMAAETRAARSRAASPFTLEIDGPATAVAGAPNDYTVRVAGPNARPVTLVATVAGPDGKTLFTQRHDATPANVTLPASLWAKLPGGTTPTLTVIATDANRAGGPEGATVTETVRLGEPRAATMLATDRPLYRPGERVYYRSVTLDRASFRPLERELNLRFVIEGPDGQPVLGCTAVGLARPVHAGPPLSPVVGPDGLPVRGVGTGAFELPITLPGGEYALKVFEVGLVTLTPAEGAKPLAVRKFLVNRYTPDKLLKTLELDGRTYGPGDAVRAKVTVRDQGRPQAAKLRVVVSATVNNAGVTVPLDVAPTATDAAGDAALKFTLPKGDVSDVTVSVNVRTNGVNETISKPVPLATRRLVVEFFPEGGDLIAGVPNRVYFRATTAAGRPADLTGTLSDGTPVQTLTDAERPGVNQGMGVFTITPVAGRADFLTLSTPTGIVPPTPKGFPLPTAKATGVVLNVPDGVTRPGEPLRVTLTSVGPAKRSVLVGAYTRGRAVAHTRATLEPGKPTAVALDFGSAKFGGVTRVTVFDAPDPDADRAELTAVAERLVFRAPGELLTVRAATQAGGASFLPGAPVELTVTTADESGAPKPAVLWAAVVSRSVLTMADDRSARLLPTHFLLAGEVQKPDDLEQADFLLTDHPKAAAALDLVLGTQGWRRFAEQAPGAFQTRVASEDGERLLLAMGGNRRPVAGASVASIRLAETYLPRYEAAAVVLARAERDRRDEAPIAALVNDYSRGQSAASAETSRFLADGQDFARYQDAIDDRRDRLPLTAGLLLGLAGLLTLVSLRTRGRWAAGERRWLRRGAVGFALLAAFAGAVTAATFQGYTPWRVAATQNASGRYLTVQPFPVPDEPTLNDGNPPTLSPWQAPSGTPFPPVARMANRGVGAAGRATVELREGVRLAPIDPALAAGATTPKAVTPEMIALANRPSGLRLRFDRVFLTGDTDIDAESRKRVRDALPPEPSLAVREYANARLKPDTGDLDPRALAAETVLWQPVLVTPADGRAAVKFDLPNGVGGYQVLVAGHSLDGRLGASVSAIEVRAPFALDVKLPAEIGSADRLTVPVVLTNATDREVRPALVDVAKNLTVTGLTKAVAVPANSGVRTLVGLTPSVTDGVAELTLEATSPYAQTGRRTLAVVPDGFPVEGSASGLLAKSLTLPLTLPKGTIPGTLRASVVVYPNALAEVQGGLDGLLREPSGCFEQASSANYPNVLALNLLRETGQASPEVSARAKGLLERGYAKLVGFECPRTGGTPQGFEWFGAADRPHLALTAYGLVQFADMARVYPVDAKLLARTRQYLLDARDGSGGYRAPADATHTFGRAPPSTVAAYVTWAITQAEAKSGDAPSDLAKELDALYAQATKPGSPEADDPFFLSLTASALLARKRDADGVKLLEAVAKLQRSTGEVGGVPTSLTASSGKSLAVEATAAAALGWSQADRPDLFAAPLAQAMAWLNAQRDASGAFGATHSTVLALKAITEQARRHPRGPESGEFVVRVAGVEVARKAFTSADSGPVSVAVPELALAGATAVTVEATGGAGTPVALTWQARTATPANAADCPVTVATALDRRDYGEGDTARVTVVVANPAAQPVGMVMVIVGLPSGLRLPPDLKQLKALTERPAAGEPRVSHFEVRPREVVLYRHGLAANESVTVVFDAVAEYPGTSRGPASRAYPYYAPESKYWVKPLDVTITAK